MVLKDKGGCAFVIFRGVGLSQIRESIKSLFPNRDCFALVRPMTEESQLQRLETVPLDKLRPEFREVRPAACTYLHCWANSPSLTKPFPMDRLLSGLQCPYTPI